MLVYWFGRPNYVPKLMKNSLEKASLIQILGAKIFIGIGSKHCKKFSITIPSCFFLKKQSLLFKCYVSTSFYFQFWAGSSARFVHYYWLSLNIFRLEDINPKKHSSMFNRLPEWKCKTFSRRPCPFNKSSQISISASFQLSLHKNWYAQTNPLDMPLYIIIFQYFTGIFIKLISVYVSVCPDTKEYLLKKTFGR